MSWAWPKSARRPAPEQENFGKTFAYITLQELPDSLVTRMAGELPRKAGGTPLPASVRRQLGEENGQLVFRGWMRPTDKDDLIAFQNHLQWQCTVERLFEQAARPRALRGKAEFLADFRALSFNGYMRDEDRQALLALGDSPAWQAAVEQLYQRSRRETSVAAGAVPPRLDLPASPVQVVSYDNTAHQLRIKGPMSVGLRENLVRKFARFPLEKPLRRRETAGVTRID